MAISYGFFDSQNHDRMYSADDFGRLFDGIITDGIFDDVGNEFVVTPSGNGLTALIDSGRAWFNNIWIYNDSRYPITLDDADPQFTRIDAIVIEINKTDDVRKGFIKVVKGTGAASNPEKPTLTRTDGVYQYALAYVTITPNLLVLTDEEIEYVVGSEETPFVSAQINQMSVDGLYDSYKQEFENYFKNWTSEKNQEFELFMTDVVNELSESEIGELQSRINSKDDKALVIPSSIDRGGIDVYESHEALDFINNDYSIEVGSDPYGLQMVNCSASGSTIHMTFKEADQHYDIRIYVRLL